MANPKTHLLPIVELSLGPHAGFTHAAWFGVENHPEMLHLSKKLIYRNELGYMSPDPNTNNSGQVLLNRVLQLRVAHNTADGARVDLHDDAMVECLFNYPASYTSHRLYSYNVHLPPSHYVNHQSEAEHWNTEGD